MVSLAVTLTLYSTSFQLYILLHLLSFLAYNGNLSISSRDIFSSEVLPLL